MAETAASEERGEKISAEKALDYVLKRFELHSANRMKVFAAYLTTATLSCGALLASFGSSKVLGLSLNNGAGICLGLFQLLMAFAFNRLDYRYASLTRNDEDALIAAEARMPKDMRPATRAKEERDRREAAAAAVNGRKRKLLTKAYWILLFDKKQWTLGKVLSAVFLSLGITGLVGAVASAWLLAS